ncbi:hypothetical protein BHE90_000154 [Fusarium euwallaceae]|uniref:Ubiquitin-like domain-containing protein n=1 Tax=Fusarium euwallaceae TaxID=1147111 RepID=A0A430MBE1_9HYPO|nr:hypothetical protein BHE90_000154 [Fusarium euwallaceae]
MAVVTQLQSQPPRPDTSRTWFQDPVRFEDALGRVLPIPSEYGWSKVHAIILDHFSTGPGSDKVKAEEYLLFNSLDSSQTLLQRQTESLIPGMSITMAFIIGRYGSIALGNCPRVGCVSRKIEASDAGGKICTLCRCWFNSTNKRIALPLRPERTSSNRWTTGYIPRRRLRRKRHAMTILNPIDASNFNDQFEEKRAFKNILIHFMDLPVTPPIVSYWGLEKNFVGFTRSECGWAETLSSMSDVRSIRTIQTLPEIQYTSPFGKEVSRHHERYDTRDYKEKYNNYEGAQNDG